MNWVKENTIFASALGVLIAITLALLVMVFLAMGKFNEISANYDRSAAEMNQLQSLRPHPNAGNLETLKLQQQELEMAANDLRARLAAKVIPVLEITPNAFQDRLRSVVSEVVSASAASGIQLPEGFYMGFNQYQDTLPTAEAAPYLNRQLTAIEYCLGILRENRMTALNTINRAALPQELGNSEPTGKPVYRYPMEFTFRIEPGGLREVVNTFTSAEQLLVLRDLKVMNEQQTGPSRLDTSMSTVGTGLENLFGETESEDGGEGEAAPAAERLEFIVGMEKLDIALTIDLLDFPATSPAGSAPNAE